MSLKSMGPLMQSYYPQMVAWRRYLHQHPELSFQEKQTASWIAKELRDMGLEVQEGVAGYGLTVTLDSGKAGAAIALRADIDALAIQDEKQVPYASTVPGVMHACGHDAHTAALLAVARYYSENKEAWSGRRRFIFQPAEEVSPGGAKGMIEAGVLEGMDAIYGVHVWSPLPYGKIATVAGPFMSSVDDFTIEIVGQGGHGGLPHETTDAIIVGSALVQAAQTIISRNANPLSTAVVSIGSFQAGTANNIIAEQCTLKGTIRTFDEETRRLVQRRLQDIVEHTCLMYGAKGNLQLRLGYPSLVNNQRESERVLRVAAQLVGEENVEYAKPLTIAEDFSFYLQEIPGCFVFVGAGNEEVGASYPHHHPRFDLDERAILNAAALLVCTADDYVQQQL